MSTFGKRRKIQIKYTSGKSDEISPYLLNTYIETGQIVQFKRRGGWVQIGKDPIRGINGQYKGEERRKS